MYEELVFANPPPAALERFLANPPPQRLAPHPRSDPSAMREMLKLQRLLVNMRAPAYLLKRGINDLPCVGDGRQSGTSGSPSILNASPEAADGGGLALIQTGDMVRIDLNACTANMLVDEDELARRRAALPERPFAPDSQSPWQEIFREKVRPFSEGMTLDGADAYKNIGNLHTPRDNH
ncbi:MAG: dihydroxy-acid dehydratase [Paracoccaceae bacterium]